MSSSFILRRELPSGNFPVGSYEEKICTHLSHSLLSFKAPFEGFFFYNLYSLPIIIFLLRSVFLVGQMHDIKCLAFCPK